MYEFQIDITTTYIILYVQWVSLIICRTRTIKMLKSREHCFWGDWFFFFFFFSETSLKYELKSRTEYYCSAFIGQNKGWTIPFLNDYVYSRWLNENQLLDFLTRHKYRCSKMFVLPANKKKKKKTRLYILTLVIKFSFKRIKIYIFSSLIDIFDTNIFFYLLLTNTNFN